LQEAHKKLDAGELSAAAFHAKGKKVVLGLIGTKMPVLESTT
jgi:hypothetical protein